MVQFKQMAADVGSGTAVDSVFLVKGKFLGFGKTQKAWLSVTLGDASGEVDGRVWDNAEEAAAQFEEGSYVRVQGSAVSYMDKIQIRLSKWSVVPASEIDPALFTPASGRPMGEILARIQAVFDTVRDPYLKQLLLAYQSDAKFWDAFVRVPAAKTIHHAYLGGLAEHTASMLELAAMVSDHYLRLAVGPLNRDMVIVGTLLHDSGKVLELSADAGFQYTGEGRLLGHIYLGARELERKVAAIAGFPEALLDELVHMILSHHGELEFGSPKRPKTLEALILTYVDNLDSKVQTYLDAVAKEPAQAQWTQFVPSLQRYLYRRTS